MAKYGNNVYGGALYGQTPLLSFSVEPMAITVISFSEVDVSWQSPIGDFTKIRLVRNQTGYPEHAEDGIIVYEENATAGSVSTTYLRDGQDNQVTPFTPGREIFYRMFLFTSAKVWVVAGSISDTVPLFHDAQNKIINALPKVFTTVEQSPLGIPDPTSALFHFLDGMSFTYEQLTTFTDLLKPQRSFASVPYTLLANQRDTIGLTPEPNLPIKNQKMLVREALYMYQRKGTTVGLNDYVEALTGWAPTTTISPNLLLSPQDSTFYQTIGNWTATNATITSDFSQAPATGANVIDTKYSCKIVASAAGAMTLGNDSPIMKAFSVSPSSPYVMSFQAKKTSGSGTLTPAITFYDYQQTALTTVTGSALTPTTSWQVVSKTATSDATAAYAGLTISWSAAGTYYVDMVCVQPGSTVEYDEARAITVFVAPNKTNFVPNPSFESNVTDSWTKSGPVTVTQDADVSGEAFTGTNSAKLVATGAWTFTTPALPVVAGNYYTASTFFKTTADLTLTFIGKDIDGNVVDLDVYDAGSASTWSRFTATDIVGSKDTSVTYTLQFSGGAGTFYLDDVQFEKGIQATEYFDGNLPSTFGAVWQGATNNSASSIYYGKSLKMSRLNSTIDSWLPPSLFWRITSYAGIEAVNAIV